MKEKRLFLTSLKQTCNEYLIKFSENQNAPKLENRKTSPCSPCAPNLLHVLVSRILGYHNLCSPGLLKHPKTSMIVSFKMKGDVISDQFLMPWLRKDSLDTVGFRTFKTFFPLLIIKQYYHHHTQSGQVQVLESLELAGWSDKTDAVSVHSELFR